MELKYSKVKNGGFTFVEILAVVAIMAILSGIAIAGVSRYRQKQVQNNYDAIAMSSYNAFESYQMKNGNIDSVSIKDLKDGDYVNNILDPKDKGTECKGNVFTSGNDTKILVNLCCGFYKEQYSYYGQSLLDGSKDFEAGSHVPIEDCDVLKSADPDDEEIPIVPPPGDEADPVVKYKITYSCSNASNVPSNQNKVKDSAINLSSKKPTRSGYTFNYWVGSDSKKYSPGAKYTTNKNITLTCNMSKTKTSAKTYTVTYKCSNASNVPSSQLKTNGKALTLSTKKPTRSGYTFNYWVGSDSKKYNSGASYTTNKALTLTCNMSKTYTVTYKCENATNIPSSQVKIDGKTLTISNKVPAKKGFEFLYWKGSDGKDYKPGVSYTTNKNLSLNCQFSSSSKSVSGSVEPSTYLITYKCSGASKVPKEESKKANVTYNITSAIPTKSGNIFVNWSGNDGKKYSKGDKYTSNSNLTLTCNFKECGTNEKVDNNKCVCKSGYEKNSKGVCLRKVVVKVNANGAKLSSSSDVSCLIKEGKSDCKVTLPTITRKGWDILGWASSSSAHKAKDNCATVSKNTTLYAITRKEVIITYNWKSKNDSTKNFHLLTANSSINPDNPKKFNTETTVTFKLPDFGIKSSQKTTKNLSELFNVSWSTNATNCDGGPSKSKGCYAPKAEVTVSGDTTFTLNVTPKSTYVKSYSKLKTWSGETNNSVWFRTDSGTYKVSKYGKQNEYNKNNLIGSNDKDDPIYWTGEYVINTNDKNGHSIFFYAKCKTGDHGMRCSKCSNHKHTAVDCGGSASTNNPFDGYILASCVYW